MIDLNQSATYSDPTKLNQGFKEGWLRTFTSYQPSSKMKLVIDYSSTTGPYIDSCLPTVVKYWAFTQCLPRSELELIKKIDQYYTLTGD